MSEIEKAAVAYRENMQDGDGATEYDFAAGAAWGMERAAQVVDTEAEKSMRCACLGATEKDRYAIRHGEEVLRNTAGEIRKLGNLTKPGELPAKGTA